MEFTTILFFTFISFSRFSFGYWHLVIAGIKLTTVLASGSFWLNLIILFVESDIEQPLVLVYPVLELLLDLCLNRLLTIG